MLSFREHHFYRGWLWFPATFSAYCLLYQQCINAVTVSCLGLARKAYRKRFTVFTQKKFRIRKIHGDIVLKIQYIILLRSSSNMILKYYISMKKARSRELFMIGVNLTNQRVFSRSSHHVVLWNIWQNSEKKNLYKSLF